MNIILSISLSMSLSQDSHPSDGEAGNVLEEVHRVAAQVEIESNV
jgi:hypothetical protein